MGDWSANLASDGRLKSLGNNHFGGGPAAGLLSLQGHRLYGLLALYELVRVAQIGDVIEQGRASAMIKDRTDAARGTRSRATAFDG